MSWFGLGVAIDGIKAIVTTIKKAGEILQVVAKVLTDVCKELGLLPDIQEEELGDKSIQAEEAGIKVKDFDTYQEYVKAIRDFQIDPEKTKRISLDEKLAKALELEIIMLMKEKPEISVKPCMDLIANHIDFFTPVKVEAFCKLLMEDNKLIDNIEKVVAKNERNPEIFKTAYATLANIEKQIDPAISDNEAIKRASKFFQNHEDKNI